MVIFKKAREFPWETTKDNISAYSTFLLVQLQLFWKITHGKIIFTENIEYSFKAH